MPYTPPPPIPASVASANAPVEARARPWNLSAGLNLPANLFSLTGESRDTAAGAKSWTANFVPDFSPVVSISAGYEQLSLTYSRKMFSRQDFDSVRLAVPVGRWSFSFSWQDFRGMDEQLKLKDTDESTSQVSFNSGDESLKRNDVRFFTTTVGATYRSDYLRFELTDDHDATSVLPISVGWYAGANAHYRAFSAGSAFIPVAQQADFGQASDGRELKQGGPGAMVGLSLLTATSARSRWLLDVDVGGRLLAGQVVFERSRENGLQLAPTLNLLTGWAYQSGTSRFSVDLLMEVSSGKVGELRLAPFHLALSTTYGIYF